MVVRPRPLDRFSLRLEGVTIYELIAQERDECLLATPATPPQ
jgi:hypothetical protein